MNAEVLQPKRLSGARSVIARFILRRTWHGAVLWAIIFSGYVASKAFGYIGTYPTEAVRHQFAQLFSSNVGLTVLLGKAQDVASVAGFVTWNALGFIAIVVSVWGLLLATKVFRGEEVAGRWELLLTGQTTARRAAMQALLGLSGSLVVFYVITSVAFVAIGAAHTVHYSAHAALFFGLAVVAGAAMFMTVGALASQLMPTRARAASATAVFFGICFLLRAMADTAPGIHWLINITPLGWIENLQPLYASRAWWLVPIGILTVVAGGLAVFFASRRDLGESMIADRDSAAPHVRLLDTPLAFAVRLTRVSAIGWLLAVSAFAFMFGAFTKSATEAFATSHSAATVVAKLAHTTQITSATTFLGMIFFIIMALIMSQVASALGTMREEEANGYLDNLLVRPVARLRWLSGRVVLVAFAIVAAGLLASLMVWIGVTMQHVAVPAHQIWTAGINAMAPAVLTLGVGLLAFGFVPRLTMVGGYLVIAWSFVIQMISSGINLNHWLLDTSVLHHISLAPATEPDWTAAAIVSGLGVVAATIGALRFRTRDLETE